MGSAVTKRRSIATLPGAKGRSGFRQMRQSVRLKPHRLQVIRNRFLTTLLIAGLRPRLLHLFNFYIPLFEKNSSTFPKLITFPANTPHYLFYYSAKSRKFPFIAKLSTCPINREPLNTPEYTPTNKCRPLPFLQKIVLNELKILQFQPFLSICDCRLPSPAVFDFICHLII